MIPSRTARQRTARQRTAAALLALAAALAPLPAHATATPAPEEPTGTVALHVAPPTNGLVAPDADLVIGVGLSNSTADDVPASTVVVRVGAAALGSAAAIDSWLAGSSEPEGLQVVGTPQLAAVRAGSDVDASVSVPGATLAGRAAGVYPVDATVVGRAPVRTVVTFTGDPAQAKAASIGVVVAITADTRSAGLLSAAELTTLTATGGRLANLLDGVTGSQAILAIDPAIIASVRALGSAAPRSATQWLDRLGALPNARFALQFADADVAAQASTGATAPLAPTSLAYALDPANFASAAGGAAGTGTGTTTGSTPAPVPSAGTGTAATLPDIATLTALPAAAGTLYWPAQGGATAAISATLHAWDSASTTLLSSSSLASTQTAAAATDASGAHLLVYDDATATAFARAATSTEDDRAAATAELAARSWTQAQAATGPMLIASDRLGTVTAAGVSAAIAAVVGIPGGSVTSLSGLVANPAPASLTDTPTAAITQGAAALTQLTADAARIEQFSPVLETPSLLTGRERAALLALLGAGWADAPDAWTTALAAHATDVDHTISAVSIRPLTTIQLFGSESFIPVYVENTLPWPVNVTLEARSGDLRLEVDRSTEVAAAPQGNTQVRIGVKATVANGEASLRMDLLDRTGQQVGATQYAEVYVRAEWERIGLGVLGGLVGLLIVFGVIRTVRRRRRARAQAASGMVSGDTPAEESGEPGAEASIDSTTTPTTAPSPGESPEASRD